MEPIVSATVNAPWGPVRLAATGRGLAALDQLVSNEAFIERLQHRFGATAVELDVAPRESDSVAHLRAALDALARFLAGELAALDGIPVDIGDRAGWDQLVLGAVRGIRPARPPATARWRG